jgi:hypothetical protein
MKKLLTAFLFLAILVSCNDNNNSQSSENDVDAARNFIRASLDRNWIRARQYLLQDSANLQRLERIETQTRSEDKIIRSNYKEASINLFETRTINDSISIITYSNSYKNQKDSLKVVKANGQWLVDLKYSFLPPPDLLSK